VAALGQKMSNLQATQRETMTEVSHFTRLFKNDSILSENCITNTVLKCWQYAIASLITGRMLEDMFRKDLLRFLRRCILSRQDHLKVGFAGLLYIPVSTS
jgi:hypothetical protein